LTQKRTIILAFYGYITQSFHFLLFDAIYINVLFIAVNGDANFHMEKTTLTVD